jgi:hypothetical protein
LNQKSINPTFERLSKIFYKIDEAHRLITIETKKWKKADWELAAKFLAAGPSKGLINKGTNDDIWIRLSKHITAEPKKKKKGAPVKYEHTPPEEFMGVVESERLILAKERKIEPAKVKDKDVAYRFAEWSKRESKTKMSLHKWTEYYQNMIKYQKRRIKLGK